MTRQRACAGLVGSLEEGERRWAEAMDRAHRGLFRSRHEEGAIVLSDVLCGAELIVREVDEASRDALASTAGLFDGTVVALRSPVRIALLPGAIFHPEAAEDAIGVVVAAARARSNPRPCPARRAPAHGAVAPHPVAGQAGLRIPTGSARGVRRGGDDRRSRRQRPHMTPRSAKTASVSSPLVGHVPPWLLDVGE